MPKHILIVEDEEMLSRVLKIELEKAGYQVSVSVNGKDALKFLQTTTPDLIFLDLIMPLMDGFEVLETMQQDQELSKIPVIVASNLGQEQDVNKAKKLGAIDYVVKANVSLMSMRERVDKFFKTGT